MVSRFVLYCRPLKMASSKAAESGTLEAYSVSVRREWTATEKEARGKFQRLARSTMPGHP